MERYHKPSKVKPIKVGDRVYLKHTPKRTENRKLQPIFDGPYRVIHKNSDVVIKIRDLRTSKVLTVHTDRVKLIHEDCVTVSQHPHVRRAFPLHPNSEAEILTAALPIQTGLEDTAPPEDVPPPATNESESAATPLPSPAQPRYALRSFSVVPDLPNVMSRPIEYNK